MDPTAAGGVARTAEVAVHQFFSSERGQTTAEYALVLLVAGLIVGVFATFVRSGALADMFQTIVSGLIERAQG
jgi:Flp pilus assembly pilin Flp